jgi:hypothetical protein
MRWSVTADALLWKHPTSCAATPQPARLTWLAAFAYLRGRSLTHDLVDLLIETIRHIGARAEREVERELLDNLKRVSDKIFSSNSLMRRSKPSSIRWPMLTGVSIASSRARTCS